MPAESERTNGQVTQNEDGQNVIIQNGGPKKVRLICLS